MDQLIKLNNKNSNQKNSQIPIKIAFQSSILKYVERKKKELSGFSNLNEKLKSFEDKIISADSNLISKNKQAIFHHVQKSNDPKLCSQINFDLIQRKTSNSFMKKRAKGHKSSLSDWRNLYGQREQIVNNKQRSNIFEDKMTVTDRLFYPARKMTTLTTPNFQNQQIKRASCKQIKQNQKRKNSTKLTRVNKQVKKQKDLVSDQNFYHLFYRTNTPSLQTDGIQNKRIAKYLKDNKHRRHQSLYGLGQNDEGFCNNDFVNSKINDRQLRNSSMLKRPFDDKFIVVNKIGNTNNQNGQSQKVPVKMRKQKPQVKAIVNPQYQQSKIQVQLKNQNGKNLSEILCFDLKIQQSKELNLRFFKPRKNKIQKAISNLKKTNSQQNMLANKYYSTKKHSKGQRQTFTNWSTLYSNFLE